MGEGEGAWDLVLPPGPNWYCPSIADVSPGMNLLVYGGKTHLVVLELEARRVVARLSGHTERVTAVACGKHATALDVVISGGADRQVIAWSLGKQARLHSHNAHRAAILAVATTAVSGRSVLSLDTDSCVIAWNTETQATRCVLQRVPDELLTCLAMDPCDATSFALGCRSGNVLVWRADDAGAKQQRVLPGIDAEVCCLAWRSCGRVAAVGRSRAPVVWDAATGRTIARLPGAVPGGSGKERDMLGRGAQGRTQAWQALTWADDDDTDRDAAVNLFASTPSGRIYRWTLDATATPASSVSPAEQTALSPSPSPARTSSMSTSSSAAALASAGVTVLTPRGAATRTVFALVPAHLVSGPVLVSVAQDRSVSVLDVSKGQATATVSWSITGLGAFVYALSTSPHDPSTVFVACGDRSIRVWTPGTGVRKPSDARLLWRGLQSKVTALACHPLRAGVLAFGTQDGRVGVYDVNQGAEYLLFPSSHRGTVYRVAWVLHPDCGRSDVLAGEDDADADVQRSEDWSRRVAGHGLLMSCAADGVVYVADTCRPSRPSDDLDAFVAAASVSAASSCASSTTATGAGGAAAATSDSPLDAAAVWRYSDLAWQPETGELLALASTSGGVAVRRGASLALVAAEPHAHSQLVNALAWAAPDAPGSSSSSRSTPLLASGSDDSTVRIWRVDSAASKLVPLHLLRGHSGRVTDLAWSMLQPHYLASASADTSVQVWMVDEQTARGVCNFRQHAARVYAVAWSEATQGIVLSGGEDQSVFAWPMARQHHTLPPGKVDAAAGATGAKRKKTRRGQQQSGAGRPTSPCAASSASASSLVAGTAAALSTTLLPAARCGSESRADARGTCVAVAQQRYCGGDAAAQTGSNNSATAAADAFLYAPASEQGAASLRAALQTARGTHRDAGRPAAAAVIDVWQGRVEAALQDAMANGTLTPELVAASPAAGLDVWRRVAAAYAKQLEAQGAAHAAVVHLLGISEVEEAVAVYCRAGLWTDAAALARARFPATSPVVQRVYTSWAEQQVRKGAMEQAAKAWLVVGELDSALECLSARGDAASYQVAARVAQLAQHASASTLLHMYAVQHLRQDNTGEAIAAFAQDPSLHPCILLQAVVQTLGKLAGERERALQHQYQVGSDADYYAFQSAQPEQCSLLDRVSGDRDAACFFGAALRAISAWNIEVDPVAVLQQCVDQDVADVFSQLVELRNSPVANANAAAADRDSITAPGGVLARAAAGVCEAWVHLMQSDLVAVLSCWLRVLGVLYEAELTAHWQALLRLLLPSSQALSALMAGDGAGSAFVGRTISMPVDSPSTSLMGSRLLGSCTRHLRAWLVYDALLACRRGSDDRLPLMRLRSKGFSLHEVRGTLLDSEQAALALARHQLAEARRELYQSHMQRRSRARGSSSEAASPLLPSARRAVGDAAASGLSSAASGPAGGAATPEVVKRPRSRRTPLGAVFAAAAGSPGSAAAAAAAAAAPGSSSGSALGDLSPRSLGGSTREATERVHALEAQVNALASATMDFAFPDPVTSAKLLLQLCVQASKAPSALSSDAAVATGVCAWALPYCRTEQERSAFRALGRSTSTPALAADVPGDDAGSATAPAAAESGGSGASPLQHAASISTLRYSTDIGSLAPSEGTAGGASASSSTSSLPSVSAASTATIRPTHRRQVSQASAVTAIPRQRNSYESASSSMTSLPSLDSSGAVSLAVCEDSEEGSAASSSIASLPTVRAARTSGQPAVPTLPLSETSGVSASSASMSSLPTLRAESTSSSARGGASVHGASFQSLSSLATVRAASQVAASDTSSDATHSIGLQSLSSMPTVRVLGSAAATSSSSIGDVGALDVVDEDDEDGDDGDVDDDDDDDDDKDPATGAGQVPAAFLDAQQSVVTLVDTSDPKERGTTTMAWCDDSDADEQEEEEEEEEVHD